MDLCGLSETFNLLKRMLYKLLSGFSLFGKSPAKSSAEISRYGPVGFDLFQHLFARTQRCRSAVTGTQRRCCLPGFAQGDVFLGLTKTPFGEYVFFFIFSRVLKQIQN